MNNALYSIKVSIVIPIYNVAEYVSDCLKSVLQQTYKNIEIIIVNDCTEDNSMVIIERLLKESATSIPYKIINHTRNQGLSAARNTGIKNSIGDYLYFLDSDDEITEDCIEKLIKPLHRKQVDISLGNYIVQGSSLPFPSLKLPSMLISSKSKVLKTFMKKKVYQMAWNKLVKKDFILNYQLYFKDKAIHEDCLWNFQCGCCAQNIAIVNETTYIYKVRPKSIMTSISLNNDFNAYLDILESIIKYAYKYKLNKNKYVYSFIEEEKFFLDYQYCTKENIEPYLLRRFFNILNKNKPAFVKILSWLLFKKDWRIRDAHYLLPSPQNEIYYLNMMNIRWGKNNKKVKRDFDKWFYKLLITKILYIKDNDNIFTL